MDDRQRPRRQQEIRKAPTGCAGLDEITGGGLPWGRPTLVTGGPGCGKTVLGMEFLVRGAQQYDEPGLFVSFEAARKSLLEDFRSFDFGVEELVEEGRLQLSHVEISRDELVETGDYSLDALLLRLDHSVQEVGAQRIVLDTLESVFSVLQSSRSLRREIARLFRWLREKELTAVITAERGHGELTQYGIEEYVSDCVLQLDHRVEEQISKRRLRVVKYRGSAHGTDEYPFLIGRRGFSVVPITSAGLDYEVRTDRVATGIADLDEMLGGEGYFQGSTVLISGKAGVGKSSLCASYLEAATQRGERSLYVSSEESAAQLVRNMKSLGIDLQRAGDEGLLHFFTFRPSVRGLEEHLFQITQAIESFDASNVVIDPITNFISVGSRSQVRSMLTRVVDMSKTRKATLLMTALTPGSLTSDATEANVSSLADTWITLGMNDVDRTRQRAIRIVKSRGMEHCLETRELVMSPQGLSIRPRSPSRAGSTPADVEAS